ncbi:MAG TPA: ABC transporter ATP-binding protein [Nocardia sp.]|uniref:ABC transporter ATP-binding protein n=1 Tax=Nocardia sp. TaxID=1821 RepID=UPI002B4AD6FF|nr:ABC transporter ATP-binding protein [Nocardia sp.]HLS76446.1 ABC transporter ATP-binding protein [Nocardia sp.]
MRVDYQDVSVEIDGARIVESVTLNIEAGGFVGIVGPNGSGKSTLLRCLYRALSPASGRVLVDGGDIAAISMKTNARQVAALTQDTDMQFDFTAREVVETGRLPHAAALRSTRREDERICAEAMATADAGHLAERSFLSLSGGERQRVLIARALAQQPRVLVLDEPTNHLDVHHQYSVLSAARALGITVVAALHDLNLAAQYCDQLFVLNRGSLVCSGIPAEVLTPEIVRRWFAIGGHIVTHPRLGVPQIIFDEQEK